MFTTIGVLSILGAIMLYRYASPVAPFSVAFLDQAGSLTRAGTAALMAIGIVVAGIFSLCSKNGRKRSCMIVAAVFYMISGVLGIIAGYEEHLIIWVSLCILISALYILWILIMKYEKA